MRTKVLLILILFVAASLSVEAQSRKKQARGKAEPEKTEEEIEAEMRYAEMLESTAQVLIIDSVVADADDFIGKIPISKESGMISTYDKFWNTTGQSSSYLFMNEFGNKVYFSKADNKGRYRLYSADKLNDEWTNVRLIDDFGDELTDINHPFMMADGTTLYFSAKSKDNLGGYDIYVTRYDINSEKFYKPENLGMPYNSTDNDYFCIIDEFNRLGWLVTDRRQPAGKVCVYTFVPSKVRNIYNADETGEEQLKNLAAITSIEDTWTNRAEVREARARLDNLMTRRDDTAESSMAFIVNDRTVYTKLSDFRLPKNRERFNELRQLKKSAEEMSARLEIMRENYTNGTPATKKRLSRNIQGTEKYLEQTRMKIHAIEKEMRNIENKLMMKR